MTTPIRNVIGGGLAFHCPGCKSSHVINTAANGPRWDYNGNPEKPTFSPSILVTMPPTDYRCHSWVKDGNIQFLADCNHELAGKTVPLPPWPHAPGTYGGIEDPE